MTKTGTEMAHVPYRGDALLRTDLTVGAVQVLFGGVTTALEPIRAEQWWALGVAGLTRWPALPDLPTIAETVPGFGVTSWMGLFAPKGVPTLAVARLREAFDKVMANQQNRAACEQLGVQVTPSSAAQHLAFMQNEQHRWKPILSRFEPQ